MDLPVFRKEQTEFTDEQETAIGDFHNALVDFLEANLHPDSLVHPVDVIDYDEMLFIEKLADELADMCANKGIYLRYPEHVTYPDGHERWSDHPFPDDADATRHYAERILKKKEELYGDIKEEE